MPDKKQRMVDLSWKILEEKYRYYVLDDTTIADYDFDMMEKEYKQLCKDLGLPPTASDMVGFDPSRLACQAVAAKLRPTLNR